MRRLVARLAAVLVLSSSAFAVGCAQVPVPPVSYAAASPQVRAELRDLARRAVSPDPSVSTPAILALRAAGPAGLDALFDVWPTAIARLGGGTATTADPGGAPPEPAQLRAALERVARQRDVHASHLYWYTDLEEAKRVARAEHKPILSLRLLGDLDQELSCANSRFFRTTLYPDPRIGALLRSGFVLHWQSERPAPRITIDFGDGRRMERTLTGNSIHYILDDAGRPVDALPGLYGPDAFLRGIGAAREAALGAMRLQGGARVAYLRAYHEAAGAALESAWAADLTALGAPPAPPPPVVKGGGPMPSALEAAPTAMSKSIGEAPVVTAMQGSMAPLPTPVSPQIWAGVVSRHAGDARLDMAARALMRRKITSELDPSGTRLIPLDDPTFDRRVAAFERVLAEDTVRNEYGMHRTLHAWMGAPNAPEALEDLNRTVYATLFLTPRRDPWLGLLVPDGYTAIENEGLVVGARPAPEDARIR